MAEPARRLTAFVGGHVQGVGFRWWVRARALERGLVGTATNLADRRVELVAEGPEAQLRDLLDVVGNGAGPGRVTFVSARWGDARGGLEGFREA